MLRPIGFRLLVKVHVEGASNLPPTGPVIVIWNHIHFVDPVIIAGAIRARFPIPLSKQENFSKSIFSFIGLINRTCGAIPVRRDVIDRTALTQTLDLLNAGYCILIAPDGTRRKALGEAKEGFAYLAAKTDATLVPLGIEGTPGLGKNLLRLRRTRISIRIGQPFRFKSPTGKPYLRENLSQMTQEAMYQLALVVEETRRGDFSNLAQLTTNTLDFV